MRGMAHYNFKGGERWARSMPETWRVGFQDALGDPTLMQLRKDVALLDELLLRYTANLRDTGRPLTVTQEQRVVNLLEQRRKHTESEARRLKDLAQMVSIEQVRAWMRAVQVLILEVVPDRGTLQMFQDRLRRMKLPTEGDD